MNVVHLPGFARKPEGDLILCDVARRDASIVMAELRQLGIARDGSISMEPVETQLSRAGAAAGSAPEELPFGDAVVWEEVMARTSDDRDGISCFLVPADAEGLSADPPERKMGLTGSATATMRFENVRIPADRLLGEEGEGLKIALAGLDAGRLGIAAVATGLAQGALDHAVAYAKERETFGRPIIEHQGLAFVLADMDAAVQSARATVLHAARLKDAGLPYSREASIAKLVATDQAMKVTTDAVQVLGGYGYTRDFPVERYMREAKVMQIFEGTNQIQRMVIARHLAKVSEGTVTHRTD